MDTRNLVSLSGVLLVIGAAGYFWGLDQEKPAPMQMLDGKPRPDYVVEGLVSLQTDESGQIARHITAKQLTHYSRPDEQAELQTPVVTLFKNGEPAWRIVSASGRSLQGNTHLILDGGVSAERMNTSEENRVSFNAPLMHLYPEKQAISTSEHVRVVSRIGRTEAKGLDASLQTGNLNLHSEVRGEYVLAR